MKKRQPPQPKLLTLSIAMQKAAATGRNQFKRRGNDWADLAFLLGNAKRKRPQPTLPKLKFLEGGNP